MGQSSSPLVAKLGTSMYWSGMWDDKFNFSRKVREDIFCNMFLFVFFGRYFVKKTYAFSKDFIYFFDVNFNNESELYECYQYKLTEGWFFEEEGLRVDKIAVYFGKVLMFRFRTFLIVAIYIYIPQHITKDIVKKIFSKRTDTSLNCDSLSLKKKNLLGIYASKFKNNDELTGAVLEEQLTANLDFLFW